MHLPIQLPNVNLYLYEWSIQPKNKLKKMPKAIQTYISLSMLP